jgi:hypothetical protein
MSAVGRLLARSSPVPSISTLLLLMELQTSSDDKFSSTTSLLKASVLHRERERVKDKNWRRVTYNRSSRNWTFSCIGTTLPVVLQLTL